MKPLRLAGLGVMSFLFAVGLGTAPAWGEPAVTIGVDSRAFGTLFTRWDTEGERLNGWNWGAGAQVSVPVFLVAKGGGLDTCALEVEGLAQWDSPAGWFARGRLTTGLSTQTQVLGSLTSWTGGLSLEPGYQDVWGEVWLLVRPQAALVTVVRPSSRATATFDDRYQGGPSGARPRSLVLGMSAVRLPGGIGTRITVTKAMELGFTLGVYLPLRSGGVGWMDGFSFGEIPFFSSFDCRMRL